MKVSILIPVRNGDPFLQECLDSILNQTYSDWELIIINDHSTDNTAAMLKEYCEKDSRITICANQGKGIIAALQLGYSKSRGDLITRMDADDIMKVDKISLMVKKLQEKGKGFVAVGLVEYFAENGIGDGYFYYQEWLNKLTVNETNFDEIYKECVVPSPSWMMFKEDFEKIGRFDSTVYPEDYELAFRMMKHQLKIASIPQVIHSWRDYSTRTSRTDEHYSDNFFLPVKMTYFFELHRDSARELTLWGAGKKGKELAAFLIEQNQDFSWVTNNPNKIGKDIYGKKLESEKRLLKKIGPQILIAIRNKEAQKEIKKALDSMNQTPNTDYFFLS